MEITKKDFDSEFWQRFGDKEGQYILDFCNTFQKTFPGILSKENLIQRISSLRSLKMVNDFKDGYTGETYYGNEMNIKIKEGMQDRDERNSVYHELFHVISYGGNTYKNGNILTKQGLVLDGIQFIGDGDEFYFENHDFDEIMNEFYTIKMLENEGLYQQNEDIIHKPSISNPSTVSTKYSGNGYIHKVYLASIYDSIFGDNLLRAKLFERDSFEESFNERFKDLEIKVKEYSEYISQFSKIGIQISENIKMAERTAINIWRQTQLEKVKSGKLDLYSYLKSGNVLVKSLPNIKKDKSISGDINHEVESDYESRIHETDEETIMKVLRPDLVGEQKDSKKQKQKTQFLAVIDTLRDHMDDLTREDLENLSYGEISQYTHSNMPCTVINAGEKSFVTFASEDGFMGSSMFSRLPEDKTQEIFGDNREVQYATIPTVRDTWSIIKDENGFIPVTENPSMEHVELSDEISIEGNMAIKNTISNSFREALTQDINKQKRTMISSNLLDNYITLPNGGKIQARHYINTVLPRYMPQNGLFKLKSNGGIISTEQFIIEYVLGELDKYGGNIEALLKDHFEVIDNKDKETTQKKTKPRGKGSDLFETREQWQKREQDEAEKKQRTIQTVNQADNTMIQESNRKEILSKTRDNNEIGKKDLDNQQNEMALRKQRGVIMFRIGLGKPAPGDQEKLDRINEILGPEETNSNNRARRNNFGNNNRHGNSR